MEREKKALRREYTAQFWRGNRLNFAAEVGALTLQALSNVAISWILLEFIDLAAGLDTIFSLGELILITVFGILGSVVVTRLLRVRFYTRYIKRALGQYKDYAFKQLMKKGISSFSRESTALYLSGLTNDATVIETSYLSQLSMIVYHMVAAVAAVAVMLWYSPMLTAIAVAFALLPLLGSLVQGKRMAEAERQVSLRSENFMAMVKDALAGFAVIKNFKAEEPVAGLVSQSGGAMEEAKAGRRKVTLYLDMTSTLAGLAAQMGVLIVGAGLAVAGYPVTSGMVFSFAQLVAYIILPIQCLPPLLAGCRAALGLVDKLAASIADNVRQEGEAIPPVLERGIEVRGVSFAYEEGKEVLRDVSVRFEAGKSYAVVGASGSGKSTLLHLLMGSHGGYSGEICYDGRELRGVSDESLYELVSLIRQEVFVFNSSIRDNITMFRDFDAAAVQRAISLSGLAGLVAERGEGYLCGENGNLLSGGERQRVAVARSLLRGSQVLLVDEATSALDAETAANVLHAILDLEGITRVLVTHTLEESALRKCDEILVFRDGRVCERGDFDSLFGEKGYFYSLYTVSQTQRADAPVR